MEQIEAIDLSLKGLLQPELGPEEDVLWFAAPQLRPYQGYSPLVLLLALAGVFVSGYVFSVIYASWAGFATVNIWQIFAILLPILMLGLAIWAFWGQIKKRFQLTIFIYAVTNERVMISRHHHETEIYSLPLASLKAIKRVSGRRGLEHLIFAENSDKPAKWLHRTRRRLYREARPQEIGFFNLANAREVEQVILSAKNKVGLASAPQAPAAPAGIDA